MENAGPLPFSNLDIWSVVFTTRRYASAVYVMALCLSVRLSVYHKPVFYQNG